VGWRLARSKASHCIQSIAPVLIEVFFGRLRDHKGEDLLTGRQGEWVRGECATRQRSLDRRGSANCMEAGASIKAIKVYLMNIGSRRAGTGKVETRMDRIRAASSRVRPRALRLFEPPSGTSNAGVFHCGAIVCAPAFLVCRSCAGPMPGRSGLSSAKIGESRFGSQKRGGWARMREVHPCPSALFVVFLFE
jgi:hypothetical protein